MKVCLAAFLLVLLFAIGLAGQNESRQTAPLSKPKLNVSIKPQHVADALHAVILSDREVYTKIQAQVRREAQATNVCPLPSPCEVLRLGSQAAASKGVEYSYVLRSLAPINPRNAP